MKKLTKLLAGAFLTCSMIFAAACGTEGNASASGDSTGTSAETVTATYRMEYYLEGDDGYALDATKTEQKTGEVGKTVSLDKKEIDGYVFETDHKSNVLRGKVLTDNSLVLKAYYSKDYTGRVVFETELEDSLDLLKGAQTTLAVTVKVNGEAVTEGVKYASSYKVVSIDENGVMTGKMRGEADISVSYKNVSKIFRVTVYDAFIETEEDWWEIYDHLSYWYKLTADVTLSESSVEHFEIPAEGTEGTPDYKPGTPGYKVNHTFEGVLDGGGHSITYTGSRLFHWVAGSTTVIRNITLNASEGFYWGSTIAYAIDNQATVENVTINAQFKDTGCFHEVGIWIHVGAGDLMGNGGMFGMVDNATISNCTVILDLTKLSAIDISNFGGICYQAKNSEIKNCKIISTDDSISVVELDEGGTTITDSSVVGMQEAEYKVEYYFETDDGDFVKNDTLSYAKNAYVGRTVAETPKAVAGYAFDEDNAGNVLNGVVTEDGALALKLYYTKSLIVFETETEDSFELEAGAAFNLAVSVTDNGAPVTEGIGYTSDNPAVATVENGMVTAVSGGSVTITVDYAGAVKAFEITVWDKFIGTADDFWSIYASDAALAGKYKLTADVTLKVMVDGAEQIGSITGTSDEAHKKNNNFTGILDGDGHTLTYSGGRLFHTVQGTIENITLNAGKGYYWGSALAFTLSGKATIRNVTINAEFERKECYQYVGGDFLKAPGAGVFGVWVDGATIDNCTANVKFSGSAVPSYYTGVAYDLRNSTVTNVTVNAFETIKLFETGENNTVTGSEVVVKDDSILISTEADWWAMYAAANENKEITGKYKLANDITLTRNSCEDGDHEVNFNFKGVLNGNGKTLTYPGARLFHSLDGTVENLTLDAGKGYYWGSALAFSINASGVVKDVTVIAEFDRNNTYQFAAGNFLEAPGAGGLAVWLSGTIENVTISVTLTGDATTAYYAGIAYDCTGATLKNVTVKSAAELVLYKSGTPAAEENVKLEKIS